MAITAAQLKLFKAEQNSNTAGSNGGRASYNEIVSGVNNNILPDVSQAERVAGATHFRKAFFKNTNPSDLVLYSPKVFVETYTPGDDAAYFHVGSHTNLQSALSGSEDLYGSGKLDANVSGGATSLTVLIESASVQFFKNGQTIRVSDRATVDGAGNEEFVTINAAPSLAGSVVTLSFTPALQNAYLASATRVANVYSPGDVGGSVSSVVATTVGSGDYNNSGSPITVPNVGGVYDQWTVTFTSGTAYTVVGAREGSVGSGSTLADFEPNNANVSSSYFSLKSAGFTGVWASGDTLTFTTNPAHVPFWVKRVVPAGAAALAGDKVIVAIDGETA